MFLGCEGFGEGTEGNERGRSEALAVFEEKGGPRPCVWEREELWGPSRVPDSERLRRRGHGVTSGRRDARLNDAQIMRRRRGRPVMCHRLPVTA